MMGKDVERILSGICKIIDTLDSCIKSLSQSCSYRIGSEGEYGENETSNELDISFTSSLKASLSNVSTDLTKLGSIGSSNYTSTSSFNNSHGSPWTEISKLQESLNQFSGSGILKYMGQRIYLLGLMQSAMSRAVDAKWALIIYHDYIQRAYDYKYNGKKPSITFSGVNMEESTGNLKGSYTENVHISPTSYDPF